VRWAYDERAEPDSPESELAAYLKARDWLGNDPFSGSV